MHDDILMKTCAILANDGLISIPATQMLYKDKGPSADSPAVPWCMARGTNLLDGASGKSLPVRHGPPAV